MSNSKVVISIITGILIVSAIILYYNVTPENSEAMPKCTVRQLTGYDCPSCGAQRAFHAALHGDFLKAISYNPFFLISIPYFLLILYASVFKNKSAEKIKRITHHRYAVYTYIALFFAWWIARNIWF